MNVFQNKKFLIQLLDEIQIDNDDNLMMFQNLLDLKTKKRKSFELIFKNNSDIIMYD